MRFTGNKDVDYTIMANLDDRSLLNFCQTDKYVSVLCRNDEFWRRRFISKYGDKASNYKPAERTWRNHYLKVLIDLDMFSNNPAEFLRHIGWSGDPNTSIYYKKVLNSNRWLHSPFLQAPEWVMNNFYLLDLGPSYINSDSGKILVNNVTPYMLFTSEARDLEPGMVIGGPGYAANQYWRQLA